MRYSLAEYDALIAPVLDAAGSRILVEIGGEAGLGTAFLLGEAVRRGGRLTVIESEPKPELETQLAAQAEACLERGLSLEVLPGLPPADAYFVDGDHNYYTVLHELRLIAAAPAAQPLIFVHDVGWPFGRRDGYHNPETIPAMYRQPLDRSRSALLDRLDLVAEPGVKVAGDFAMAAYEGGPRNGVLTAVEDFLAERAGRFSYAAVPLFSALASSTPTRPPGPRRWRRCSSHGTTIRSSRGWSVIGCAACSPTSAPARLSPQHEPKRRFHVPGELRAIAKRRGVHAPPQCAALLGQRIGIGGKRRGAFHIVAN